MLTISVVFPSCDQIQPMDGLFYTKDEVAPYCSPENRSFFFLSFSFLFKILFELHGRTSSDCVVRLNYLPLVFYIVQKKKKRKKLSFFFFLSVFVDSRSLHLLCLAVWIWRVLDTNRLNQMTLDFVSFCGSLVALLNNETYIDGHQ